MPGNYQKHVDEFGICECGPRRNGTETMVFEVQDEYTGRYRTERVPACADCFGLL